MTTNISNWIYENAIAICAGFLAFLVILTFIQDTRSQYHEKELVTVGKQICQDAQLTYTSINMEKNIVVCADNERQLHELGPLWIK